MTMVGVFANWKTPPANLGHFIEGDLILSYSDVFMGEQR